MTAVVDMNMHVSWCSASEEEDAAADAPTSGAELGRDEIKPGQRDRVLGAR